MPRSVHIFTPGWLVPSTSVPSHHHGSDLSDLMPDIMRVLRDLFSNSLLTRVRLDRMSYVPRSLLSSPLVTFLSLDEVEFGSKQPSTFPHPPLARLKELEHNHSPTFYAVVSELSEDVVPMMETVLVQVRHNEDLRVLECLRS